MPTRKISTGIPPLDEVLQGIHPGDSLVWQVDSNDSYIPIVEKFARHANVSRYSLIYFRFGHHDKILSESYAATVIYLNPQEGFEEFISQILQIINQKSKESYYIFDNLNDLAVDWYSDVMVANFFMLIAPYLQRAEATSYFAMYRNKNLSHALRNIHTAAQIVIDVYPKLGSDDFYLYPIKVENRHSSTIHMLHHWKRADPTNEKLIAVRESGIITEILENTPLPELNFTVRRMDSWFSEFKRAQDALAEAKANPSEHDQLKLSLLKNKLIRMMLSDDDRMRILAVQYLDLEDLVKIGKRMVGTGQIGGKSSGFLIARGVIQKKRPDLYQKLEKHDSFFVGSDLFYTYLIRNNCWEDRRRVTNSVTFLQGLQEIHRKLRNGRFERYIRRQFSEMLNYFGQSPIVVRSSSLQEDAFGNSFSGKYETVFCPNQGPPEQRLENFIKAVKTVYASAVSKEALIYRREKGLLNSDEEMALLVQRVSGTDYGKYFLPHIAGVGFSFNPFVWNEKIDPSAGFLRLVFGLGTRAVDRTGDDYTRLVAINQPTMQTSKNIDQLRRYSQYYIDLLSLEDNQLKSVPYHQYFKAQTEIPVDFFTIRDEAAEMRARQLGFKQSFTGILTLDPVLTKTDLLTHLQEILHELETAYSHPVDIEIAVNFYDLNSYTINLLQCRPFQVRKDIERLDKPENIPLEDILISFQGPVIGTSRISKLDWLIYISPVDYAELTVQEKYYIARVLGEINRDCFSHDEKILLLGPGRWGTSSPNLGVPVKYEDINKITILGEIAEMHEHLIPDISLGTHFFNNIVEDDLLYFALNTEKGEVVIKQNYLLAQPNDLAAIFPQEAKWANVIKITDLRANKTEFEMIFYADAISQTGMLYRRTPSDNSVG